MDEGPGRWRFEVPNRGFVIKDRYTAEPDEDNDAELTIRSTITYTSWLGKLERLLKLPGWRGQLTKTFSSAVEDYRDEVQGDPGLAQASTYGGCLAHGSTVPDHRRANENEHLLATSSLLQRGALATLLAATANALVTMAAEAWLDIPVAFQPLSVPRVVVLTVLETVGATVVGVLVSMLMHALAAAIVVAVLTWVDLGAGGR